MPTGVQNIRFTFPAAQENGFVYWSEIAVVGTATTPEPSTLVLLGIVLLVYWPPPGGSGSSLAILDLEIWDIVSRRDGAQIGVTQCADEMKSQIPNQ